MSAPHRDQLGRRQRAVLKTLAERNNGEWFPGCGWHWGNKSTTIKLLDSLVRRGLVERTETVKTALSGTVWRTPLFRITDDGRLELSAEARR
jgi:hypothetical protein